MDNKFGKISRISACAALKDGRTILEDLSFTAPYKIMMPFEKENGGIQIMPLCASAGIMAGDSQEFSYHVKEGADLEVLEGNLTNYADDPQVLIDMLAKYGADMMSVCVGANFIYQDALEDEMVHLRAVAEMAAKVGVKYFVICGGAIRGKGIRPGDVELLAKGLSKAMEITEEYGLVACFHPHLGSIAEKPEEIDALFAASDIKICPDLAHLKAGGYDPLTFIKKYYDRIAFIHLKDLHDNGTFAPLGTGNVDNKGVIEYVKSKGYDGDWLVECDAWPNDPVADCKQSYEYLKGLLF